MAKAKKQSTPADEKLEEQKFDLWEALAAIDNKDYGYYSRLTVDQQRKFAPYMLLMWISAVKSRGDLADYYVRSTDHVANKFFFNETVSDHPELQWLMLCAASPGIGKQFHVYIPQISVSKIQFREPLSNVDAREYFSKIGLSTDDADYYADHQQRAVKLAKICESLNIDDVSLLATIITDAEIEAYYRECGN